MSWFNSLSNAAAAVDKSTSIDAACSELIRHVPESFSLDELRGAVEEVLNSAEPTKTQETNHVRRQLLAILACLRCRDRIRETSTDQTAIQELAQIIAKSIAPVVRENATNKDDNDLPAVFNDDLQKSARQLISHCQAISPLGLHALQALIQPTTPVRLDDQTLLTLIAYTDKTQDWTTPETAQLANELLLKRQFSASASTSGPSKEQFLTETVLQRYLRPLFSRSKPASITSSGRKAEYADGAAAQGQGIPDDSAQTKPWKYTDLGAIPAVTWAVKLADDQLIAHHWPLFIPVLLTLADDSTTAVRRQGLVMLNTFLKKFPDKTLNDTGLAQVFEDAIFPTLSFLPSLTPDDESVQLLVPAYTALLTLTNKLPAVGKDGVGCGPKNRLLDKMLREGILMGYFHAKEHVRVVDVLCQQATLILDQMGIHAVKHLKDVVPMLSTIMTDPFAPSSPATLLSATGTLQSVLSTCWPRIPASPWQDDIINALALSWLHLAEYNNTQSSSSSPDTARLHNITKEMLLRTSQGLATILKIRDLSLAEHVVPLVSREPPLAELFPSY